MGVIVISDSDFVSAPLLLNSANDKEMRAASKLYTKIAKRTEMRGFMMTAWEHVSSS